LRGGGEVDVSLRGTPSHALAFRRALRLVRWLNSAKGRGAK